MLDSYSRKVLKFLKKHKQATFNELIMLDSNHAFMVDLVVNLNWNEYIIRVSDETKGKRQAVYELKNKGIAALEEYKRYIWNYYPSIFFSIIALIISIIGLIV